MESAIRTIVDEVPREHVFDSHFVMNELIKRFSNKYLSFAGGFATDDEKRTLVAHGKIGQEINKLNGTIVDKIGAAWSENIHKKPSPCTCWKKR